MHKTTLYLDDETKLRLKTQARLESRNQSSLIRQAVSEYLVRRSRPKPQGIGAYRSGRDDVSERIEELLEERERPGS